MNDHDKENLNFLLTSNPDIIKDWFDSVTEDDHKYAIELLTQFAEELEVKLNLLEEGEIDNFSEANNMLKKFML